MTRIVDDFLNRYKFITGFTGLKLSSITSAMPEPYSAAITDEVSLNFENGKQIVLDSSYHDTSLLFFEDEDVLLDIRKESNYEVVSHTEPETPICSILVDEIPSSITLLFEKVMFTDEEGSAIFFPVGLFVKTPKRSIGIWREMLEAFWLCADYVTASFASPYKLTDRWGECIITDKHYIATRYTYDFFSNELKVIDQFVN